MTIQFFRFLFLIMPFVLINQSLAQISVDGTPTSSLQQYKSIFQTLPTDILPTVNLDAIIREDQASNRNFRFAVPIQVNYSLKNAGTWTVFPNGDRVWRLQVQSPNAKGLAVLYKNFHLPKGATLFMYSPDKKEILGAYTSKNNKSSRKFLTGLVHSDTFILEYYEPKFAHNQGVIEIHRIMHAYKRNKIQPTPNEKYNIYNGGNGFECSLPCHINVNCTEGDNWQNEKRSVVRIMIVVQEGMGWCSGSLINNTQSDGKPFVLSAFHCQDGYTPEYDYYRFDFNYEMPDCNNSGVEPSPQSIVGCMNRAGLRDSDFSLFELSTNIPLSYEPYFAGWNRSTTDIPQHTSNIHHPSGDVKKISIDNNPAFIYNNSIDWNNDVITPANYHFFVNYDAGTFEGGSSGSPLFDPSGKVIGQLHGGNANCSEFEAFFGRFALSWDVENTQSNQLKHWLDPIGTTPLEMEAYDPLSSIATASISGTVVSENEQAVLNTKIYLYDVYPSEGIFAIDSIEVDNSGFYEFTHVIQGEDYYVIPQKDVRPDNGVSTYDIVLVQQIVLGLNAFDSPYKYLSADVNLSGDISTFDVVQTRQLILNFIDSFPKSTSWRFARPTFIFENPENPFESLENQRIDLIEINGLSNDRSNQNFVAYKIGDVNNNALPGQ